MTNDYGLVCIGKSPGGGFPHYALAETGYGLARDKSGYFILGGFAVENNNGVILAPSLFLRSVSKNRLSRKSALSWATDVKQWVRFIEVVQVKQKKPPYTFDLMSVDQDMLKRYGDFLTRLTFSREGKRLTTATVRNKLLRVCTMQQWFADNRWYLGDLGPRAERASKSFSIQPMGLLAHIHKQRPKSSIEGPMGSAFAQSIVARRALKLPRSLTQADQSAVEEVLKTRLESVAKNSPRYDQYLRDQLIFNVGRFVGLRVENMTDLPVAKVLALRLDGMSATDPLSLKLTGKGDHSITPAFTVELLRQMQAYADTARQRAITKGKHKDPAGLFVSHLGAHTGKSLTARGIQKAMEELFVQAGLSVLVLTRTMTGEIVRDERGVPVCRTTSRFSVHDLRHTCAARLFYATLAATGDREQAMRKVQAQLCHLHIETTERKYAELTRRFSTWKTFSDGLAKERAATPINENIDEILETVE